MPYVVRNTENVIVALLRDAPHEHAEFLQADHPEVIALVQQVGDKGAQQALAESDLDIARVIEDIIQLLVHKNTIMFTDLPTAVQQKLLGREKLRETLKDEKTNFWEDDEGII